MKKTNTSISFENDKLSSKLTLFLAGLKSFVPHTKLSTSFSGLLVLEASPPSGEQQQVGRKSLINKQIYK